MVMMLLGYFEELILYQLGAYVCFDLKVKIPWMQAVGAGACVLLAYISDVPDSIVAYGVMLIVMFAALREEWKKRLWHIGVLFILTSGMDEFVEIPETYLVPGYNGDWRWIFPELVIKILILLSIYVFKRLLRGERERQFHNIIKKILPAMLLGMICCLFLQ